MSASAATATIEIDDTVRIDGRGARFIVDFITGPTATVTATFTLGRGHYRTETRDVAASRLVLVRKGNADIDAANAVLASAGLPLI